VKAYLRITGAVLMGAILIVGALLLPKNQSVDAENGIVVSQAPKRTSINTDKNGNGKPDWEEELSARVIDSVTLPTSTPRQKTVAYEAPTTFTGKFSESFASDYLKNKADGTNQVNQEELIQKALKAIDGVAKPKIYTTADFIAVPDSDESIRAYGNELGALMKQSPSVGVNEMVVVSDALKANDPEALGRLTLLKESYTTLTTQTLEVPVPLSLAQLHAQILTGYEAIRTDIEGMELAFTDPLYALARIKSYTGDVEALFAPIYTLQTILNERDITYTDDEPGAYLFVFRP
jgi:hypothetical protein